MRYAGILKNDFVNGEDVCVSFWTQGCPHHCPGCHNPKTWSFEGGKERPVAEIIEELKNAINQNGIQRNFSVLGGEPLCKENREYVSLIIDEIREAFPDIKMYIWTGYTAKELLDMHDPFVKNIVQNAEVLITGRFEQDKRDITSKWYGSTNQMAVRKDGTIY